MKVFLQGLLIRFGTSFEQVFRGVVWLVPETFPLLVADGFAGFRQAVLRAPVVGAPVVAITIYTSVPLRLVLPLLYRLPRPPPHDFALCVFFQRSHRLHEQLSLVAARGFALPQHSLLVRHPEIQHVIPDPVRHASLLAAAARQRPHVAGHEVEVAANKSGWVGVAHEVVEGGRDVAPQKVEVFI